MEWDHYDEKWIEKWMHLIMKNVAFAQNFIIHEKLFLIHLLICMKYWHSQLEGSWLKL